MTDEQILVFFLPSFLILKKKNRLKITGKGIKSDPEWYFKKVKVKTEASILFRVRCFLLKQSFSLG